MSQDQAKPGVDANDRNELEAAKQTMTPPRNIPTPRREVEAPMTPGEVVETVERIVEAKFAPVRTQLAELHSLLMGIASPNVPPLANGEDGRVGGIGTAFHDLRNDLASIKGTGEAVFERLGEYTRQVQTLLGTEVAAVHEGYRVLLRKSDDHEHRIALLEAPPPDSNGTAHHGEHT